MHLTKCREDIVGPIQIYKSGGISDTLGVMTFAYMCHHNTFLLYFDMENASVDKWKKVTHAAVATAFVIMALFAMGGYATFASLTQVIYY